MVSNKIAAAIGGLCLLSLAPPAWAGAMENPRVVQGYGPDDQAMAPPSPQAGRYGGGFIEFLVTGHTAPAAGMSPRGAYMASVNQPQEPDTGYEPEPTQGRYIRPQPGYAEPRKAVDPLAVPELIQELKRRGHPAAEIRKVVYDNPLAFWRQSNNWSGAAFSA